MTVNTLSLNELRNLSPEDRAARISAFSALRNAPPNGEATFLDERIRELETRYEIDSATMLERVRNGSMPETADIGKWIILLDAKNSLAGSTI